VLASFTLISVFLLSSFYLLKIYYLEKALISNAESNISLLERDVNEGNYRHIIETLSISKIEGHFLFQDILIKNTLTNVIIPSNYSDKWHCSIKDIDYIVKQNKQMYICISFNEQLKIQFQIKNDINNIIFKNTFYLLGLIYGLIFTITITLLFLILSDKYFKNLLYFINKSIAKKETPFIFPVEFKFLLKPINNIKQTIKDLNKKVENQAKLAAIGAATSIISHDIRRPFNNLKSFIDTLPEHLDNPDHIKSTCTSIIDSVSSVSLMLDEMMEFSKKSELSLYQINFYDFIKSSLKELFIFNKAIPIKIKLSAHDPISISIDQFKMIRVIHNLVDNAVEAMRGRGAIWINSSIANGQLTIFVGNDGPMIPEKNLKKLFEPFATFGKEKGTGLGLAITKQIVESHRGSITVENTEKGPEFTIILPIGVGIDHDTKTIEEEFFIAELYNIKPVPSLTVTKIEVSKETDDISKVQQKYNRLKYIMIVDDDQIQVDHVSSIIKQIFPKAEIISCNTYEEADGKVFEYLFDLIISDYDLGKNSKNGLDLIKEIKKVISNATYLLVSSRKLKNKLELKDNNISFIPKPIDKKLLIQTLLTYKK